MSGRQDSSLQVTFWIISNAFQNSSSLLSFDKRCPPELPGYICISLPAWRYYFFKNWHLLNQTPFQGSSFSIKQKETLSLKLSFPSHVSWPRSNGLNRTSFQGSPDGIEYVLGNLRHPGHTCSIDNIRRHFWWTIIQIDVSVYVATCSVCPANKTDHQLPEGLLLPLPIPHRPWSHATGDFVAFVSLVLSGWFH